MPANILLEEYHITLRAPSGLRQKDYRDMLRVLRGKRFQSQLRNAVRELLGRHRSLKQIVFTLER